MIFCEENGATLDADNGLYLSQNVESVLMGGAQFLRNKNYLLITPVLGAEPVEYTYSATQQEEIEQIRRKYMPKEEDRLAELKRLDEKVSRPGTIVGIALGVVGTLTF